MKTVHAVCPHDCYDTCGLTVTADGDRIIRIAGDGEHPITRGFLCFKVNHYEDRLYHPDRVLTPLRRVGPKGSGEFEPVSWDEALAHVGAALRAIVDEYGGEAVLPYSFSGNMGILSEGSMDRRFFHALGASRLDRTICTAAAGAALRHVYGLQLGPDPETLPRVRLVILWGTNPMATNIHEVPLLDTLRKNGGQIWCIDPLRTATAARSDRHVQLAPNSDYALAMGLAREILRRGLYDKAFVSAKTTGLEAFQRACEPWTKARVIAETGLLDAEFESLLQAIVSVRPLLFRSGYGVQRQNDGAKVIWAVSCLSILLGTLQDVGGGHLVGNGGAFGIRHDRLTRPDLMPNPRPRRVNMLTLGQALSNRTRPPVKALIVYNSNPAATAPDQRAVLSGLQRGDLLTIVHEQMMTDTARYADWVFPAAMAMETLDIHTSYWHRYVQLSVPATRPLGESVSNSEFFRRLARAVGLDHPALQATDEELIDDAIDSSHPWMSGICRESLEARPVQKVRLASDVRPFVDTPIPTADGKLHLDPLPIGADPILGDVVPDDALHLISPSRRESIKSSFGNIATVVKQDEPELLMHDVDLTRRGLTDGDAVVVFNALGETLMRVRASDVPAPGTVVSYAVRWNERGGGTNINQLTSQRLSDYGGGGTFYSTWVRVRRA
ncbi:molybdopterin-dependent oxidoreductase [Sulfobacillus harzensis]|uniref:Molybdopterin-dependent oxidoreductase n=1 Tax=Sulfobacillus harzensis TaxID=2729629 RepID=A0A7Y0Q2H9_9FIRM|nr:molybdopterin-dependent oxidoreductase [Sulfobacillus harzensis]